MESRQSFVRQVADSIIKNHSQQDGSFIFGISGKWGEGKTYFLKDLEKEIKEKDSAYQVYWINPWKFSNDKTSFLRNFLAVLYKSSGDPCAYLRGIINNRQGLKFLYRDTSESIFHPGWVIATSLYIFLGIYWYIHVKNGTLFIHNDIKQFYESIKQFRLVILLPIALGLIGKLVILQKSNHAVSTLNQFDSILDEIILGLSTKGIKPVVFVDDLDRVSPKMARNVLDNLRTFFDKKEISFIVAGDHSVLERFLGKDLLPEGELPEQMEEGKRFMKKIFNVYWRLPLPIDQEVSQFVEELFIKRQDQLNAIFSEPKDIPILKKYLDKYFEKNFRQIERFFETTIFTFQIIKEKLQSGTEAEKTYFEEVAQNPLLVVRVLMIQELCSPLFDKILENYEILSQLEYAVEKQDDARLETILDENKEKVSKYHKSFIKKFLYQEPRFFKGLIPVVTDLRPFLFLAADSSFGDSRGPEVNDFMQVLEQGDPSELKNLLISTSSIEKAKGVGKMLADTFQRTDLNENVKVGYLKTLASALGEMVSENPLHDILGEELVSVDFVFLNNHPEPVRQEVCKITWKWLDKMSDEVSHKYLGKFSGSNIVDFNGFNPEEGGAFSTRLITKWLISFYPQNNYEAVNQMSRLLPALAEKYTKEIESELTPFEENLTRDFIVDAQEEYREKRWQVIKLTTSGRGILKQKLIDEISGQNQDLYRWVRQKASTEDEFYSLKEIEGGALEKLLNQTEFANLHSSLHFIASVQLSDSDTIWDNLKEIQRDLMAENFIHLTDRAFQHFSPNKKEASAFMQKVINKIKVLESEGEKLQWLELLKKGFWAWNHLDKLPLQKLKSFANAPEDSVKSKYEEVQKTWDPV